MRRALVFAAVAAFAAVGSGVSGAQSPPPRTSPGFLEPNRTVVKVPHAPTAPVAPVVVAVPAFTG